MYGGQVGGQTVVVPAGTLVRVRLNRSLSSNHSQVGSSFDGVVVNDVVAGGVVAIPRGAQVSGTVLDAKSSGVLKGRGELSIQLTQVTLGRQELPCSVGSLGASWWGQIDRNARSNGRILVHLEQFSVRWLVRRWSGSWWWCWAAAGLGSSAASGRGQVFVPAEGMLAV